MSITQEENLELRFEKKPVGLMRSLDRVGATTKFELRRNVKNMIISLFDLLAFANNQSYY